MGTFVRTLQGKPGIVATATDIRDGKGMKHHLPLAGSLPEKVSVTPGMTLEMADSVGGLKGRVVWSLLHLGRCPLVTTVYHTAQLHPLVKDKWDTSEAFGEAVQSLTDDKVCYIVKPDRITLYNDSPNYAYKVVCSIPGCKVEAPSSSNKEAARDRAIASGFRFFNEEGKAEMAVCPAGNYLHNNIRDRIDGKSPSRADRRRLEKMQAKQARRSNNPL